MRLLSRSTTWVQMSSPLPSLEKSSFASLFVEAAKQVGKGRQPETRIASIWFIFITYEYPAILKIYCTLLVRIILVKYWSINTIFRNIDMVVMVMVVIVMVVIAMYVIKGDYINQKQRIKWARKTFSLYKWLYDKYYKGVISSNLLW